MLRSGAKLNPKIGSNMSSIFPESKTVTFYDPLADLLGAGDGRFTYSYDDAVKLSGHACPTVAGAFLMVVHAMRSLYGDETPQRGDIKITITGARDQGVFGPISQVFTLMTGAASDNGFHGLAGQFARNGLLRFKPNAAGGAPFTFERIDSGRTVTVSYDPSGISASPDMGGNLQMVLQGNDDLQVRKSFTAAWRDRVLRILADAGESTVSVVVTRE